MILVDINNINLKVAIPIIVVVAIIMATFLTIIIYLAVKARQRPIVSGKEKLLGSTVTVMLDEAGIAKVKYRGELWMVKADAALHEGQQVEIVAISDNMSLVVKPLEN